MATPASIGLDIGSMSIRAVQMTRGKDRPMIDNFGQVALPDGAVVNGVVQDERAVAAALRQLWSTYHFKSKSVRLGVAHQQVVVRELEVPNLPPKEMRRALPHQARDVLPFPVEQAILDFYPLETPRKGEPVRGLLIGAPKEAVIDTVRAVAKAGLQVDQVDLSCFAVLRAVAGPSDGAEVIIDIGAQTTMLVIHSDGVPQIVRTIPRGGAEITKLLSTRLHLSLADAEQLKCGGGEPVDEVEQAETIDEALRPLLREISSSVTYYVNGAPERRVSRVSLVGAGSRLPGFQQQLTGVLNVPVSIADPFQYVSVPRHRARREAITHFGASAAVSIGLTLGAAS